MLCSLSRGAVAWSVFSDCVISWSFSGADPGCLERGFICTKVLEGAQWLSGRVLDSRQRGRGFEPHRGHCVVVLEQDTFILA